MGTHRKRNNDPWGLIFPSLIVGMVLGAIVMDFFGG
jgi:uncharacterized membrane-anchored protein YhcB (DUF1043 family)